MYDTANKDILSLKNGDTFILDDMEFLVCVVKSCCKECSKIQSYYFVTWYKDDIGSSCVKYIYDEGIHIPCLHRFKRMIDTAMYTIGR